MNVKKIIESLVLFALVTLLPFFKVFLLGTYDSGEQVAYIRVYFWLQFLIPLIDFGFYWSLVRAKLVSGKDVENGHGFSLVGLFLGFFALPFDVLYSQLIFLAVITAWYNCQLQFLRIDGESRAYYVMRLSKVGLDILFVFSLYLADKLTVQMLLLLELFSLVLIVLLHRIKSGGGKIGCFFGLGQFFTLNYLYSVLKVMRANIARISVPLFFMGQGIESVLFAVLVYELFAQFISVEKLKELLAGKVKVLLCLFVYVVSLPVQYGGIVILSQIMAWNFGVLEVLCVLFGGGARLFSIYTLNVVKNNAFNVLVYLNVFLVIFAIAEIYSIQQLPEVESPAQVALLLFYGVEALVGLGLIVWLEKSKSLKRM